MRPEFLLLHLEKLLFELISLFLHESHLVLEKALLITKVLLQLNNLSLQLLHLLLNGLGRISLGKQAQLLLVVDIGKALALSLHIFLPILEIISHALVLTILPSQPRLIIFKLYGMAKILFLLIIDQLTFGFDLGSG